MQTKCPSCNKVYIALNDRELTKHCYLCKQTEYKEAVRKIPNGLTETELNIYMDNLREILK